MAAPWGDPNAHFDRAQWRSHWDLASGKPGSHVLLWLNGEVLFAVKIYVFCERRWRINEGEESILGSSLGRPGRDLSPNLHWTRELCALRGIPGTGTFALMLICMYFFSWAKLIITHFTMQRIVSGDFGGEVHLWDLRSKDGKFEVANHRKWECHKVFFSSKFFLWQMENGKTKS